ncbi:MAG: tetratricopeptide repeat protein, partial [Verrucomicrobiales bacterium]|nr:tetratricopeptide repeat protein [Verrucomicrobiales bacterium]
MPNLASHTLIAFVTALALLGTLALPTDARAQANTKVDASDVYLQAYLNMQEAEKLEKKKDFNASYFKYQDASKLFDSVAQSFPTWNPQMVDFRRRRIREKISFLRSEHGITPTPADPTPTTTTTSSLPSGSAVAEIQLRFAQYDAQIARLNDDRTKLLANLESKENVLRETRRQLFQAQQTTSDLNEKLVASEELMGTADGGSDEVKALKAQVADLKSELAKAADAMTAANARTGTLLGELEQANATIKQLRTNEADLSKERDQLAAIIRDKGGDPASAQALMVENMRLKQELDDAKLTVSTLEGEKLKDAQLIADLRSQVSDVRIQLAQIQRENRTYKAQITELTERLKMTSDRITGAPEMAVPEAVRENQLLRNIIIRQLKTQSRREQAKRIVLEKLSSLELDSAELLAQIENVAGPPVVLSESEQGLFKDPQFENFVGSAEVHANLIARANPDAPLSPVATASNSISGPLQKTAAAAAREFQNGNFRGSEAGWAQILEAEPQNVFAMEELSVVKLRMRQFGDAESILKKALAYNFENPMSHFLLGVTHYKQGNPSDAIESIEQGLMIDPNNARARHYLGLIAAQGGDSRRAELEFQ